MRISDWSSDVCSSDLARRAWPKQPPAQRMPEGSGQGAARPGPARQSTKVQRPRNGKRPDMNQPLSKIATHPQFARAHELARAVMPGCNHRSTAYETRSDEHTTVLQSLMRLSYAVFFLKNKNKIHK